MSLDIGLVILDAQEEYFWTLCSLYEQQSWMVLIFSSTSSIFSSSRPLQGEKHFWTSCSPHELWSWKNLVFSSTLRSFKHGGWLEGWISWYAHRNISGVLISPVFKSPSIFWSSGSPQGLGGLVLTSCAHILLESSSPARHVNGICIFYFVDPHISLVSNNPWCSCCLSPFSREFMRGWKASHPFHQT